MPSDWANSFYGQNQVTDYQQLNKYAAEVASGLQPSSSDHVQPSQAGGKKRGFAGMTKKALYERACKRDIKGRSGMSKAELIAALRR
jgi:hypothetical protein